MAKRRTSRQRVASRRNLIKARRRRLALGAGVGVLAVAAGAGVFALDRKYNTMMVYHNTSHARARKIVVEGYKAKHRQRAFGNMIDSTLHESGRVFLSTRAKSSRPYGYATVSARVRKKKFYKYATRDVHPKSRQIRSHGGIAPTYSSHYHVQIADLSKAGIKLKYTRAARKEAGRRIRNRYIQGSLRDWGM